MLVTNDLERTDVFIQHTLGDVAAAPDLHATVLAYIAEQHNASAAADRLFVHPNTLMPRIAQAERLLPKPLSNNGTHIAIALEVLQWQGTHRG